MRKLSWRGTAIMMVLFGTMINVWAQDHSTACDKSCMGTMRDLIKMKKAGMGTSWLEKANLRLGDKVADGVTKSFPGSQIYRRANIRVYLPIIHVAFEAPGMIQITQNRKPIATIRMLDKVKKAVTDESSRKEISDLIEWLSSLEP